MDEGVAAYIEALPPQQRPLFDRLHAIVLDEHPDAEVALAYGMPAYRVGTAAAQPRGLEARRLGLRLARRQRRRVRGASSRALEREGDDPDPAS